MTNDSANALFTLLTIQSGQSTEGSTEFVQVVQASQGYPLAKTLGSELVTFIRQVLDETCS